MFPALEAPPQTALMLTAAAIIFAAALVSSIAGFAFSAIAGAALLHVFGDPMRAVSVMVACSVAIQGYAVWSLRRSIEWRRLVPYIGGGMLTVPAGVWLLARVSTLAFAVGLGLFLTAYGIYMLCRREPPVLEGDWRCDLLTGLVGGVTGGLAGFPGALVTIWCGMRGWSKERQRAVYQPYILAMQLEALLCLSARAPAALAVETVALYAPMALGAAVIGLAVFRRLTTRQFARVVNALLIVSGLALVGGAVAG